MLRKLINTAGSRSASTAAAVAIVCGCRGMAHHYTTTRQTAPLLHAACVAGCSSPTALFHARRTAATSAQQEASDNAALTDAEIIAAADWKSPQYEERLGFRGGDAITEERLKRHYYVLAKHFHPDTAGDAAAGDGAKVSPDAFHNVKEAYDAINATLKDGGQWSGGGDASYGGSDGGGPGVNGFGGGFNYSDEARRRSQMRILGETMMLFVAMTVLLIFVVGRHNKSRMQSRYLWHLVFIFFMIQLFPRLLAAAILFAAHSMYLLDNTTLKEQAAVSLIVERREKECTVKLEGIKPEAVPNVVVQVTTSAAARPLSQPSGVELKEGTQETLEVSSTLTFDKGVLEILLPVPLDHRAVYHVRAVDEQRKLVLVDRTVSVVA
uniref:J domain-containing protein n=1 Tax=Angomonas deanei TaxID=59799 RepID=C6K3P8_9TRYP|nr:hypothetical protein CDFL6B12_10 [Angomonas deanei]